MPTIKDTVKQQLDLFLDGKLNFSEHINEKIKKTNKDFNVIKKTPFIITTFFIDNSLQVVY